MSAATPTGGLLAAWEDAHQVLVVPIGQVLFVNYQETPAIGTRGLGSCSVAMIVSEYGAILAHISPLPLQPLAVAPADPHAGDNNARMMMDRVYEVYTHYREFFPVSNTHVVCAWYQGDVALPDQLAIMQDRFRQMGLEPAIHKYVVPGNRAIPGQGTVIVISSGPGELPGVYVEDELVNASIPLAVVSSQASGVAQESTAGDAEYGLSSTQDEALYGELQSATGESGEGKGNMQTTQGYADYEPDDAPGQGIAEGSTTIPGGEWREVRFEVVHHLTSRDEYVFRDAKNRRKSTDRADWHKAEYKGKAVWTFKGRRTTYYTYQKIRQ